MDRSLITPPTVEVVDLATAKLHLRVDVDDDDNLITAQIAAAREGAEADLRRALVDQTWDFYLDEFPDSGEICLPLPPLRSVTSVKYIDGNGTEQTLASNQYVVEAPAGPTADKGRVRLAYGCSWPTARSERRAIRIRCVCGYGAAGTDVPKSIRTGILLLVGNLYENRQDVTTGTIAVLIPKTSEAIFAPFRVFEFE